MQPHNSKPPSPTPVAAPGAPAIVPSDPPRLPAHPAEHHVPTRYVPGTGRKLLISVAILALVLICAFVVVQVGKSRQENALAAQTTTTVDAPADVDVAQVSFAPATQSIALPGETRAWYESTIYARVSGYLGDWSADIGDHVKKGQVLANIETPDLDAQLRAAEDELSLSQSQVEVANAAEEFAASTYKRWEQSPKGVVSEQERDQKKSEYDGAMANVKSAESKVSADESEVNRLDAMEAFKKVTAPFDGVITARRIDIGDLVTAGSTSNTTSLYAIAQINRMRVYVDVPQRQSAAMRPGIAADITASQFANRTFIGTISRTSDSIDPATGTLHVEIDVPNPDQALMPGMYLQVAIHEPHAPMVQVPASALIFRSDGTYVAVVGDEGTVRFHKVKIAVDNGDVVELASGLSATDKVALNLSDQIVDGDKVDAVLADAPAKAPSVASTSHSMTGLAANEK